MDGIVRIMEWTTNSYNGYYTMFVDEHYEVTYILNRKTLEIISIPDYEIAFNWVSNINEITYINPDFQFAIDECIGDESLRDEFVKAYENYHE